MEGMLYISMAVSDANVKQSRLLQFKNIKNQS